MEVKTMKAYAKVNLALHISKKREDGYHEIYTLMHMLPDLWDDVIIEPWDNIEVSFDIPMEKDNTVWKAAKLYYEHTGFKGRIHVKKRIPMQAGLGGGSSDAVAALLGLNSIFGALSSENLSLISAEIGSDVPFFFSGGAAVCRGRGEIVEPLPWQPLNIRWDKPKCGISTKELFKRLQLPAPYVDVESAVRAYVNPDRKALGEFMKNSLEDAAFKLCKESLAIKERFLSEGALGAVLTGSGSAVIALFEGQPLLGQKDGFMLQ
ncbi:MAG: 4-(cytidine 5'-diphospho)-2-C-methyl-D-erythritol kinase [Clostridia bacterium]|nr:4-(cytidine 5'-diphospho)-2-C-methyl-D-erythritol kinase [Clostridia bacterium]